MAYTVTLPGDLSVTGNMRVTGSITPLRTPSELLSVTELAVFTLPWTAWRTWDALATNLPATPATDDLGLVTGTLGSDAPSIQTGDLKSAGATTRYARAQIELPYNYQAGQTVTLRFHAGMITTVADTTATLDVVCYKSDEEAAVGADICATAAQSINSLVYADIDFTITPTGLEAGDLLDVRIAIAVNDGSTGTAVIGCVGAAQLLCDVV